jgi:putative SOS response-associated peptidase YedK
MCGRFTLTKNLKVIADRFSTPLPTDELATIQPRYNIAPTQFVIVVGDDGQRYMKQMKWGLIPSWAKDPAIGNRMINTRAETVADKPAFRGLLKKRRCLIPSDGFYEWQLLGKVKQPVHIVLTNREPFGFAGLWDHWKSPAGEEILSCTIITTEANDLLKQVHDRMPVILTRETEAQWLDPQNDKPEQLLPLLKQYPSDEMGYYPVSRQVNSPMVDKPSNIELINVKPE